METLATFAGAMAFACIFSLGLGWAIASTGGMRRYTVEKENGKEVIRGELNPILKAGGFLTIIGYTSDWGVGHWRAQF